MNKFSNKEYNLEDRTARFAEKIINLCKKAPQNVVTIPIINQLLTLWFKNAEIFGKRRMS